MDTDDLEKMSEEEIAAIEAEEDEEGNGEEEMS